MAILYGLLTSVTDPKGNTTSYEYDIQGRVTKKINPDLTEREAVYDDVSNYVTIYDELDSKRVLYYDGIGQLTKIELYLSPTVYLTELYTYDYQGNLKTMTDTGLCHMVTESKFHRNVAENWESMGTDLHAWCGCRSHWNISVRSSNLRETSLYWL